MRSYSVARPQTVYKKTKQMNFLFSSALMLLWTSVIHTWPYFDCRRSIVNGWACSRWASPWMRGVTSKLCAHIKDMSSHLINKCTLYCIHYKGQMKSCKICPNASSQHKQVLRIILINNQQSKINTFGAYSLCQLWMSWYENSISEKTKCKYHVVYICRWFWYMVLDSHRSKGYKAVINFLHSPFLDVK